MKILLEKGPRKLFRISQVSYGCFQINFICVFIKLWVTIKDYIYYDIVGQRLIISNNWFYTIHKIVAMGWKLYATQKVVSSISKLQEHKRLIQSWKFWWNFCSLRWLRTERTQVSNSSRLGPKYCTCYSDLGKWRIIGYLWTMKFSLSFFC